MGNDIAVSNDVKLIQDAKVIPFPTSAILLGGNPGMMVQKNIFLTGPEFFIEKPEPLPPPPLQDLRSKVFAVHAADVLPEGGVLKSNAKEVPWFRPTFHWSLGSLMPSHAWGNWEEMPYAVVTPLGNLEQNLVNLSAYDTFTLGNFRLNHKSYLLVPKGTNLSKIPSYVPVIPYEGALREAVDRLIEQKGGWNFQLKPGQFYVGSTATLGGREVNSPDFFNAYFKARPELSFGNPFESERGEAFRFGTIDRTIQDTFRRYQDPPGLTTIELEVRQALILHHLSKLEAFVTKEKFSEPAKQAFVEAKKKLQGWLNVMEMDLKFRRQSGKTFNTIDEKTFVDLMTLRSNPKELEKGMQKAQDGFFSAPPNADLDPQTMGHLLSGMDPVELDGFLNANPQIFGYLPLPEFYSHYAVRRWLLVDSDQARAENLDGILEKALSELVMDTKEKGGMMLLYLGPTQVLKNYQHARVLQDVVGLYHAEGNTRQMTATEILNEPAVKNYLSLIE